MMKKITEHLKNAPISVTEMIRARSVVQQFIKTNPTHLLRRLIQTHWRKRICET